MSDRRKDKLNTALKKLRHPLLDDLPGQWISYTTSTAGAPSPSIESVPGLAVAISQQADGAEIDYVLGVRETALAKVSDLYAKAAEAFAASRKLEDSKCWLSATPVHYDACFYVGKALCHVLGYTQLSRSSKWMVDIFPEFKSRRGRELLGASESLTLHDLGRWEHQTVWYLLSRIARTVKGSRKDILDGLKSIDYDRISDRRNAYLYDCRYFGLAHELANIDVPSDKYYDLTGRSTTLDVTTDYEDAAYYQALYSLLHSIFIQLVDVAGIRTMVSAGVDSSRQLAMAA